MAKLKVKYTAQFEEVIDWPDDEIDNLNYENLQINLSPSEDSQDSFGNNEITSVKVNGTEFNFN